MKPSPANFYWREIAVHGAILILLLVGVFPKVFIDGEVPLPMDRLFQIAPWAYHTPPDFDRVINDATIESLTQFVSWAVATNYALENGEWPLWNRFQFTGAPLAANFQSAVFYPFRLLHALLGMKLAVTLYHVSKLWLCGMTAFLCARGIGLRLGASQFFSVAWMLSGYAILWCYWQETDVAAWLPVVFLGTEWLIDGRYRRGTFAVMLGGTLIILAGHPETALTMCGGVGIYFFLRLIVERRRGGRLWRPIASQSIAWAVALLVCSIVIIPFFEYLQNSFTLEARATGGAKTHFTEPRALLAFWAPRFFGSTGEGNFWAKENSNFVHTLYTGVVIWVGIAAVILAMGQRSKHRLCALCLIPGVLFFLALAVNLAPVAPLNDLPLISSMWGIHHAGFVVFAFPLLGALGVDYWFQQRRTLREWLLLLVPIAVCALIVLGGYLYLHDEIVSHGMRGYTLLQLQYAALFVAGGLAVFALACFFRRPVYIASLCALVLAGDLLYSNRGMAPTIPSEYALMDTPIIRYLQRMKQPARISCQTALIPAGIMPIYRIEQLWMYDGIFPERMMTFMGRSEECDWLRREPLCAIQHYLFATGAIQRGSDPRYEWVATEDGIDIFRNTRAFPHAYLLGRVDAVADTDAVFEGMCSEAVDLRRRGFTAEPPEAELPQNDTGELGEVEITSRTATEVVVDTDVLQRSVLVIADAYYPGWKAYVGTERAEVFPVNHAFRAVIVPPGEHQVTFRYRPVSFTIGLTLATLTLIFTALAAIAVLVLSTSRRLRRQ